MSDFVDKEVERMNNEWDRVVGKIDRIISDTMTKKESNVCVMDKKGKVVCGSKIMIHSSRYYPLNTKTGEILNKSFKRDGDISEWNYGYTIGGKKIPPEHIKSHSFRKNVTGIKGSRILKWKGKKDLKIVDKW